MPTNNLARFYWAKLERAEAIFEDGKLEGAGEIYLQLINDFDCPRFCQVEAWNRSRCHPDNYWFAKSSLDQALGVCISCKSYSKATERDLEALADVKKGVEAMSSERATQYREYWQSKGREPPNKDEWYEIAEAEDADAGEYEGYWLEVVKDENGIPLSGDVKAWPFEGPVPSSFLERKTFPPEAAPKVQESSKVGEQKRQHDEEQSRQEIENVLRGFYPQAPSPAGSGK